jgi:hypothetical protein
MSNLTTYDRSRAERLVPLLASITREIQERQGELARLDRARQAVPPLDKTGREQRLELRIRELRQELRRSERELAVLGCTLDRQHPLRVLIPGGSGGFAFDGLSGSFHALPAATAAR